MRKTTVQRQMYKVFKSLDDEDFTQMKKYMGIVGPKVGTKHPDLVRTWELYKFLTMEIVDE